MSCNDFWDGNDIEVKFPDGTSRTVTYFCDVEYDAPMITGSAWIWLADLGVESEGYVTLGFASKEVDEES